MILKSGFRAVKLVVVKKSPEITLALGLVSGAVAIGAAIKNTMSAEDIIDEHLNKINELKEKYKKAKESNGDNDGDTVSNDENRVKETVKVYGDTVKSLAKLYLPTIIAGTVSVALILTSHGIMKHRNAMLVSSLAEVTAAYNNYRDKVKEIFGEEKEKEILGDTSDFTVETDEEGNVVKATAKTPLNSPYARFFDSSCSDFSKSPDRNMSFLTGVQDHFNDLLRINHNVFLNEVYDALGFDRTPIGALVGWTDNGDGDGYIDFGLFNKDNHRFVNRYEPVVLLDFNVDGVIYDKI
jgi:hypothetical protein